MHSLLNIIFRAISPVHKHSKLNRTNSIVLDTAVQHVAEYNISKLNVQSIIIKRP